MKYKLTYIILLIILAAIATNLISFFLNHREAALIDRATTYWESIKAHDLESAYLLEAETGCGHFAADEVELQREWGTRLISFTLGEVVYYMDNAEIVLGRVITQPDTQTSKLKELPKAKDLWTFCAGKWYHGKPSMGGSGLRKRLQNQ